MKNQYALRIQAVKNEMAKLNLDAFLVPHEDEYLLEEVSDYNNRLKWLSGFSGTAGIAVVMKDKVILFVDGRYKVQVAEQVDEELFCFEDFSAFENNSWLQKSLPTSAQIGIDPKLHAFSWYKNFTGVLCKEGMSCIPNQQNLIDSCWTEKPAKELNFVEILDEKYHGQPSLLKIKQIADLLKLRKVDSALLTSLDSICWLLNLRGRDIPCLPVFYATALINQHGKVICFLDLNKIPLPIQAAFDDHVSFKCESELDSYLLSYSDKNMQIDPQTINAGVVNLLTKDSVDIIQCLDPVSLLKAQKNSVELSGIRACHLRDGAAVVNFLSWLDNKTRANIFYDEAVLSDKLESYRSKDNLYQQPSFDTVSAAGSNGAMCHYNHKDSGATLMKNNSVYLVDSGAHYLDGTTDVTRTVAIGTVNDEQIKMATLVLKGHIALASMKFPHGTTGQHLDAIARQYLWQHGFDYAHGTGHGVGHNINVHEGPQRIAKSNSNIALLPGMIVSIEPGYYRQGEFGIRHENLYVIKESEILDGSDIKTLQFEVLTYVPFDRKLINKAMLCNDEIIWLNNYHQMVYSHISPLIDDNSSTWLEMATKKQ